MKFLNSFCFFIGISILFSSCSEKKVDPEPAPVSVNKCRPESISGYANYNNQLTLSDSSRYTYNTSENLIQLDWYNFNSGGFLVDNKYTYDANGRLFQRKDDQGRVVEERQYNSAGLFIKANTYSYLSNGTVLASETDFDYNAAGHLKKVSYSKIEAGSKTLNYFRNITPNVDGLIGIDSTFFVGTNGTVSFFTAREFQYDNKIGISKFGFEPSNIGEIWAWPQKHNVISEKKTDAFGDVHTVSFQYTYNNSGYPETIKIYSRGIMQKMYKVYYSCF